MLITSFQMMDGLEVNILKCNKNISVIRAKRVKLSQNKEKLSCFFSV